MSKNNLILIYSGVAAAGKGSVSACLKNQPEKFSYSVSYTTRSPRPGDKDGDYHFVTEEEFNLKIKAGDFLEWEEVHGYKYGTAKKDFDAILASGKIPVLELDVKGMENLKKRYRGVISIFIIPPSVEIATERLKSRASESKEEQEKRISRYNLELSYKDKYDHLLINDDLERAQKELLEIVDNEIGKHKKIEQKRGLIGNFILLFLTTVVLASGFYYSNKYPENSVNTVASILQSSESSSSQQTQTISTESIASAAVPATETKKKIAQNPPKYTAPASKSIVSNTTKNTDGSTTTTISTGGEVDSSDLARAAAETNSADTPYGITFRDETGIHSDVEKIIKDYLNNTLKWRNEIVSMKEITLRDAGDTGWSGQYLGQYQVAPDGRDITSANGSIILNAYYYKNSDLFNEYMKLVLAHEYGHHYTLYHKWVDWDLPMGSRFPDSYYQTRPLSKTTTAVDYSLGWKNCEAEILAEDYSYLYSGYGFQAMSSTYGYPSVAIRSWLEKIGDSSLLSVAANSAPIIDIIAPTDNSTVSGQITIKATATDDIGVDKVSLYVGEQLVGEDSSAPYEINLNTTSYENGQYIIKAVASDGSLTANKTINLIFSNEEVDLEKPVINLSEPKELIVELKGNSLPIYLTATDNVGIDRIEFYFNDVFIQSWESTGLSGDIPFKDALAGSYKVKFKVFDTAGNFSEVEITVIKS